MPKKTRWSDMRKDETPFSTLRDQFRVYNKASGKSRGTVAWYEQILLCFERSLGEDACLADFDIHTVRRYVAELQERTTRHANNRLYKNHEGVLSSSYIQGNVRALRAFASWLHADSYTDTNILKPLKPPKVQTKVIDVLTDDEVRRLVATFDRDEPYGARGYAIVWTLLDCGLRAAELCELTLENSHLDQGYLKVLGKGNKERLVPIGHACQDALLRWRDRFRSLFEPRPGEALHLFLNAEGRELTVNALQQLVGRAGERAAVPRVHTHLLRHTFATNYLVRQVGDPLRLQQILGHTSLEMVRRYISAANIQRSLLERRASPMDLIAGASKASRRSHLLRPPRSKRLGIVR
jgi:site-specific recombinase XerD